MKNKTFYDSFKNAMNGILQTAKTEKNMKFHILAAAAVLLLSMFYRLSGTEFAVVLVTAGMVIVCELMNTAIEILMDIIVDIYHPKAKIVKDIAAGAVMFSALISIVVGGIVFFDRVCTDLERWVHRLKDASIHRTAIVLGIMILIAVLERFGTKDYRLAKVWKVGLYSAVSFASAVSAALWTDHIRIVVICLGAVLAVILSRIEVELHRLIYLLVGAGIGLFSALLLFRLLYS